MPWKRNEIADCYECDLPFDYFDPPYPGHDETEWWMPVVLLMVIIGLPLLAHFLRLWEGINMAKVIVDYPEVLGIIRNPDFGCRDTNFPILWFTVETLEGDALMVVGGDDALQLIRSSGVYSIKDLHGRGCVLRDENGILKFVRLLKTRG